MIIADRHEVVDRELTERNANDNRDLARPGIHDPDAGRRIDDNEIVDRDVAEIEFVMRWIEAAMHGDRVPRYLVDGRSSVEHVYPRNPENNWTAFENGLEFNELATLREMIGSMSGR